MWIVVAMNMNIFVVTEGVNVPPIHTGSEATVTDAGPSRRRVVPPDPMSLQQLIPGYDATRPRSYYPMIGRRRRGRRAVLRGSAPTCARPCARHGLCREGFRRTTRELPARSLFATIERGRPASAQSDARFERAPTPESSWTAAT